MMSYSQSRKKADFCTHKRGSKEASCGVVRWSSPIQVHEVWKKLHIFEDGRKMHRTDILGKEFGKMV